MIIFLYGENDFLAKQKLKKLKTKFLKDVDPTGSSISIVEGGKTNLKEINEKVGAQSLLVRKRMVVIENIFLNKTKGFLKELVGYLKTKEQDENILIFIDKNVKTGKKNNTLLIDSSGREKVITKEAGSLFNFLVRQKFVQEFKIMSNFELANWVRKKFEGLEVKIDNQTVNVLVGLLGNDLWSINNEVEKLASYKDILEVQDVEEMVKGKFDENIFAMSDAISARNKALTMRLLEEQFKAGLAPTYLLSMIIRQFKILLQIRQALDLGQTSRKIISQLKLHPFIVQKGINQVRNFDLETLKKIYNELVKIDYEMKTGKDLKVMLEILFNKILN